ncbi:MAG TPA: LytTR family transcriptional regulator DNA-binding domain-containing protein [Trebonia sp.]|nr:LytTR family transcriptional regulator DNA-binding domain-containing protein [Trebonia sp.]
MNGAKDPTNDASVAANGLMLANGSLDSTVAAWERFVAGADSVQGVRPEILMSWHRCREEYGVSPCLDRAPAAVEASPHSIEHDVVFAELGGVAASAADQVGGDCVATVTDPGGIVLTSSGSQRVLQLAAESNLAPWYSWSEWSSGTNGMGTALESHGPVIVAGPEHWCRAFHSWICAGIAVRDVVTGEPLAALGVSRWKGSLPGTALPWLRKAVAAAEATLRQRATQAGTLLAAAFADSRLAPSTPLAAVDVAGKVVLANTEAAVLLGIPADTPAYAPADRWAPHLPALSQLVGQAMGRARQDPHWSGSAQVFVPFLKAPVPVAVRPVRAGKQVIGALLAFGSADSANGDLLSRIPSLHASPGFAGRSLVSRQVVALRQDRWVLLEPAEIRFAEADRNNVWLMSDQGRLLAANRGLDRLEQQLGDKGFLRVHRRYLVNLNRIREIEEGFKGSLFLHTDTRTHESIPVARRHAADLRRTLGLHAHG